MTSLLHTVSSGLVVKIRKKVFWGIVANFRVEGRKVQEVLTHHNLLRKELEGHGKPPRKYQIPKIAVNVIQAQIWISNK